MKWFTLRNMRSSNLDVRAKAFDAAKRKRDVSALLEVANDADEYVRSDAIEALGAIADPISVPTLIERLADANFNNQERAAVALTRIGDARAILPLTAMLRDSKNHRQARHAAAAALKTIGDPRANDKLLDALQDRDTLSNSLSLEVLAVTGDSRCVPAAIAALGSADENVSYQAVHALAKLRDSRAVEPLLKMLSGSSGTWREDTILQALDKIGDARVIPFLVERLGSNSMKTREVAAMSLKTLGWQPASDYDAALFFMTLKEVSKLKQTGWDKTHKAILDSLAKGEEAVKQQAVEALGDFGGSAATEALITMLKQSSPLCEVAACQLAKAGDIFALTPLIDHSLRYAPTGGYRNNPHAPGGEQGRASEWVKPLADFVRRTGPALATADLQRIAALQDKEFTISVEYDISAYGDGSDSYSISLDLSHARDIAKKELRRRGFH